MPKKIKTSNGKKTKGNKKQFKDLKPAQGALVVAKQPAFTQPRIPKGLPSLTECAAKYFAAIANPWHPDAKGACIPTGTNRDSFKTTVFSRFTATVGAQGFGFVALMPCLSNDLPVAVCSTAAYNQTLINPITVAAGVATYNTGVAPIFHNGPLTTAQLTAPQPVLGSAQGLSNSGRIVSVGMSCQYTGTVMNMGGLTYCLSHPFHQSLAFASTATVGAFAETDVYRVGDSKCWISDFARTNVELEYANLLHTAPTDTPGATYTYIELLYPFAGGTSTQIATSGPTAAPGVAPIVGSGLGIPTSIVVFTGVPGNTFEVEIIMHVEYIGVSVQNAVTKTHHDEKGFSLVQAAAGRAPEIKTSSSKSWAECCMAALKEVAEEVGPIALAAGKKVLTGLLL